MRVRATPPRGRMVYPNEAWVPDTVRFHDSFMERYARSVGVVVIILLLITVNFGNVARRVSFRTDGDRDAHGCSRSAGYTWDQEVEACVGQWKDAPGSLNTKRASRLAVEYVGASWGLTVTNAWVVPECDGCFHVVLEQPWSRRGVEQIEVQMRDWKVVPARAPPCDPVELHPTASHEWRTYRSDVFGYCISYPNDWQVEEYADRGAGISVGISPPGRGAGTERGGGIIIMVWRKTLEQFIAEYDTADLLIDGTALSKITQRTPYNTKYVHGYTLVGSTAMGLDQTFFFIPHEHRAYVVSFHDDDDVHRAILESFQFENMER